MNRKYKIGSILYDPSEGRYLEVESYGTKGVYQCAVSEYGESGDLEPSGSYLFNENELDKFDWEV